MVVQGQIVSGSVGISLFYSLGFPVFAIAVRVVVWCGPVGFVWRVACQFPSGRLLVSEFVFVIHVC